MKKTILTLILFISCLMVAAPLCAQQDFSGVEIKTTQVSDHIYMLEGSGGNIGVSIGEDGVLIVDDQFAPLSDKILAAIAAIDGEGMPKYIINTHFHGDHTGGNETFGKSGTIIAQDHVRERLSTKQVSEFFNRETEASPHEALPVITFEESLSVHFNGEEIKVRHYPHGHTDGDSIVYFTGSNVVHMGDHFFSGRYPFIDIESGGNLEGMIENIEDVMAELPQDVKLIPGHGPLSNLDDLETFHTFLSECRDIVQSKIDGGKDLETIQKEGLPEKWASWAEGFLTTDKWLFIVYTSLRKESGSSD